MDAEPGLEQSVGKDCCCKKGAEYGDDCSKVTSPCICNLQIPEYAELIREEQKCFDARRVLDPQSLGCGDVRVALDEKEKEVIYCHCSEVEKREP